jgi:hypothetical protein
MDIILLNINWKYILLLWSQRNTEILGVTETEQTGRRKNKMIKQIQELQQKHQELPQEYKHYFDANDDSLEQLTEDQLAEYLHGVKTITKIYMKPRQVGIRKYLTRRDKSELDPGEKKLIGK